MRASFMCVAVWIGSLTVCNWRHKWVYLPVYVTASRSRSDGVIVTMSVDHLAEEL